MQCEMCGKEQEFLKRAKIDGSIMRVCESCANFGKTILEPREFIAKKKKFEEDIEPTEFIAEDYSSKIRDAREKLGLTQEELAKKLAEKVSIIHKLESGHFEPGIELARKLENFLKIKLVLTDSEELEIKEKQDHKSSPLTIGDLIKEKLEKNKL